MIVASATRARVLVGALTGLLLLTGACGGGDTPAADPTASSVTPSSPDASPSSADPPSPADPPSSSAATSTFAGATPADGPAVVTPFATVHAPQGWGEPNGTGADVQTSSREDNPRYNVLLSDDETLIEDASTDELARRARSSSTIDPPLERQPDVVLAGLAAYHLAGPDPVFQGLTDEFGLYVDGHKITVTVSVPETLGQTKRDAIVAAVMASFTLTN